MANPNPNYPAEYTLVYDVVNFTKNYSRFFEELENAFTDPVIFSTGEEGRMISRSESIADVEGFLIFIRFRRLDGIMVTIIHRYFDFYVVGRQTGDGLAYVLDNRCLERTQKCLTFYGIEYEMILELDDSYSSLESFSQVRRAALLVGSVGMDFALEAFSLPDANTDTRATGYGFLFFSHLISEPIRVGPIRDRLLAGFSEKGVLIPENELQYEYAWKNFSYLLNADHFGTAAHFSEYTVRTIDDNDDIAAIELCDTFPVIKQTKRDQANVAEGCINIREHYRLAVDHFYLLVPNNYPKSPLSNY